MENNVFLMRRNCARRFGLMERKCWLLVTTDRLAQNPYANGIKHSLHLYSPVVLCLYERRGRKMVGQISIASGWPRNLVDTYPSNLSYSV